MRQYSGVNAKLGGGAHSIETLIGVLPFRFTVVTTGADTFQLPIYSGGTYDFVVKWGDGSSDHITAFDDAAANHSYTGAGTHVVSITGTITGWRFNNLGDITLIHEIKSWGPLNLGNLNGYFYGCSNLTITASDNLDMVGTTTLQAAFRNCSSLTTAPFLNILDTAAVTDTKNMFNGCSAFNQSVANFNTAAVTNMRAMFYSCHVFNQSVAGFNTAAATDMRAMFYNCPAFNQSVAGFNTAAATNMGSMFYNCSAFNQSVAGFNTAAATDMSYMFYNCSAFNQSVANFNTAAVTGMGYMFYGCHVFNQSVAGFNTAAATNMGSMFRGCSVFNQDLSSFVITALTTAENMFFAANAFSTANYDALLVGWEGQVELPNVVFHAGDAQYSAGAPATARGVLVATSGWTITDGGQVP